LEHVGIQSQSSSIIYRDRADPSSTIITIVVSAQPLRALICKDAGVDIFVVHYQTGRTGQMRLLLS